MTVISKSDSRKQTWTQNARFIETLIQQDPGKRGLAEWAVQDHILPATESLMEGKHILLTTGFFIKSAGVIETDGPPGAVVLAEALVRLGKEVTIIVDSHSVDIMKAGFSAIGREMEIIGYDREDDLIAVNSVRPDTTHFVAIERPGMAVDGKYYNFRGDDISFAVAPVDTLFSYCAEKGIRTIGIGDGGNELGMGLVSDMVDVHVAPGRAFSCKTNAHHCVCAGVSNWAGYGKAALLSLMAGRNLLPSPGEFAGILNAVVEAGAVDGVSGEHKATVDGLDASWEHDLYGQLFELASGADGDL